MAEQHEELKTVRMDAGDVDGMVGKDTVELGTHDGRFGEKFDDELNIASVIWVTVGIAVVTVLGFLGAWWIYRMLITEDVATTPPPPPVVAAAGDERRLPQGPLLQASPEAEMIEMLAELDKRINGYGWVDEGQQIVHIPIEKAIDLVLETGLPEVTAAPWEDAAATPEPAAGAGGDNDTP